MAEEAKTEIILKDPLNIIIEAKNSERKQDEKILGLTTAKLDFWKWFFGTLLLGIAGVIATYIFKSYELKIESRKSENSYLGSYLNQYINIQKEDSVHKFEKAKEIFDILYLATTDSELKVKWDSVRCYFANKIDTLHKGDIHLDTKIETLNNRVTEKQLKSTEIETQIERAKSSKSPDTIKLADQLGALKTELGETQKELMDAATQKLALDKYANQVLLNPPTVLPSPTPNYELIYDLDRWAAINYFNQRFI
jgi:hypothetical protein